jgi:hypothetical protein
MTEPNPSAEPADLGTDPAAPVTTQQQDGPQFDPSSLPPEAQAWIKSQVEAAGFKARDNARKTAAEKAATEARAAAYQEIAQKLGLAEPEQELTADDFQVALEEQSSRAFRASVEGQMYRVAAVAGYDVGAMLDSKAFEDDFIDALDEHEDITEMDPRSREFAEAVKAAMAAAVEKHPRFAARTGPRPDPSQGARGAGPDVDSRIAEAQRKGDWKTVIALQNDKLAKL